jgi:hypothetical protein
LDHPEKWWRLFAQSTRTSFQFLSHRVGFALPFGRSDPIATGAGDAHQLVINAVDPLQAQTLKDFASLLGVGFRFAQLAEESIDLGKLS